MHLDLDQVDDPRVLRDAWRGACWRGDPRVELASLERWRALSPDWEQRAQGDDAGSVPADTWLAAGEVERAAAFPAISTGCVGVVLDRVITFASAVGDPVELDLARQGVATDRLRACPAIPELHEQVFELAEARRGTPVQQARACLNAAWVSRADRDAAVSWGREGLSRLGPVTLADDHAMRELNLHLLQQASEFLPWPEQSVMAQSMLALLAPGEHPAWRARILRRLWNAALQHSAEVARPLLLDAVEAAIASRRGRTMWEIASALVTCVQFRDLPPTVVVEHLRRLSEAADHGQDLLAAVHIKSYLVEVLAQDHDDAGALRVGESALASLGQLRGGDRMSGGRMVSAAEWSTLWASLAATVAHAAGNVDRHDQAVSLAAESVTIHTELGYHLMAATTALELAEYRTSAGNLDAALEALDTARELAGREGDRDLQARAHARVPSVVLARDGALEALDACDTAQASIEALLDGLDDPLERGLVVWEAMDLRRLRAEILADAGGLRQAVEALDGVADRFLENGYSPQAAEVLVVTGHYLAALGDDDGANDAWSRAVDVADEYGAAWIRREAVAVWADWLSARGRHDEAAALRHRWEDA